MPHLRTVPPAMTQTEYDEQTILRQPTHPRGLECASRERDGTLILWNAAGACVVVSREDSQSVAALAARSRITEAHAGALLRIIAREPDPVQRALVTDLLLEILDGLPPSRRDEIRANLSALTRPRLAVMA